MSSERSSRKQALQAHNDRNASSTLATVTTLLSIDEYLHTSYKPDVDFVDGEIEERNLGEFDSHAYKLL